MLKIIHSTFLFGCITIAAYGKIDFNSQIKSLLSNKCVACHGPDDQHREARIASGYLRGCDTRDLDGYSAIVPGNPEDSEILFRVTLPKGDEEHMPPKGKGQPLTEEEVALLSEWIKQGAKYDKHWSYKQTVRRKFRLARPTPSIISSANACKRRESSHQPRRTAELSPVGFFGFDRLASQT